VSIKTRTSRKAFLAGVSLIVAGGVAGTFLSMGWLLAILVGIVGLLLSLRLQQTQIVKERQLSHTTDTLLKQ